MKIDFYQKAQKKKNMKIDCKLYINKKKMEAGSKHGHGCCLVGWGGVGAKGLACWTSMWGLKEKTVVLTL